jgi:hypothetical protein
MPMSKIQAKLLEREGIVKFKERLFDIDHIAQQVSNGKIKGILKIFSKANRGISGVWYGYKKGKYIQA